MKLPSFVVMSVLLWQTNQMQPEKIFAKRDQADIYFKKGLEHIDKREYIEAIGDFTNAIEARPKYAEAFYKRAQSKRLLGEKVGFTSSEFCTDLLSAMSFGHKDAKLMLAQYCDKECFNKETAFFDPSMVFCADFSSSYLGKLPSGFEKLESLISLNLSGNQLAFIDDKAIKCHNLLSLDISQNKLTSFGSGMAHLTIVEELDLAKNKIRLLDNGMAGMKSLKKINLKNNELSVFPHVLEALPALEELDLAFNILQKLPDNLTKLKKLKKLNLVGNPIGPAEQKRIVAAMPSTAIQF